MRTKYLDLSYRQNFVVQYQNLKCCFVQLRVRPYELKQELKLLIIRNGLVTGRLYASRGSDILKI